MTNKQLSFLLKQIAWRIRRLGIDIEVFITEGVKENRWEWEGEGERPLIEGIGKGWKRRPTGQFTAVKMVEDFAIDLEIEAELLVSEDEG